MFGLVLTIFGLSVVAYLVINSYSNSTKGNEQGKSQKAGKHTREQYEIEQYEKDRKENNLV